MHRTLVAGVVCSILALVMPQAAGKRFIDETGTAHSMGNG
jgi:hypothetical protein